MYYILKFIRTIVFILFTGILIQITMVFWLLGSNKSFSEIGNGLIPKDPNILDTWLTKY